MKSAAAILIQWRHQDPDRLLQTALRQAEQLAEMSPELERLGAQNAWLSEQLEAKTNRILELEEALEAARARRTPAGCPFPDTRTEARRCTKAPRTQAGTSRCFSPSTRSHRRVY